MAELAQREKKEGSGTIVEPEIVVDEKTRTCVIKFKLPKPKLSSSGDNIVSASTSRFSKVEINGKLFSCVLNIYGKQSLVAKDELQ